MQTSAPKLAMKTSHPLKKVLLWVCLIGLPIGAFWLGGRVVDIKETKWRGKFAQIELALLIYHDEHAAFPPRKYQPEPGGPIHSWRVLLVPYTSGDKRYSAYDFTQEWNSTNNVQALSGWEAPNRRTMPSGIFRMAHGGDGDIAHYLAIGEDDDWPSRNPLKSFWVKKGKDRFLLVEDPDSKIHWMEPTY